VEFGLKDAEAYDCYKASEMMREISSAVGLPAEWKPYTDIRVAFNYLARRTARENNVQY